MNKESEREKGYNEASNDIATAIQELRHMHDMPNNTSESECIHIPHLVARFQELRTIRFSI